MECCKCHDKVVYFKTIDGDFYCFDCMPDHFSNEAEIFPGGICDSEIRMKYRAVMRKIRHTFGTRHNQISLVKSVFRIAAGLTIIMSEFFVAGICLVTAEILGIAEEF